MTLVPDTFTGYAIRRKSDHAYLPMRFRRSKNGSTHDDPVVGVIPRQFKSHRAAKVALSRWLKGRWYPGYERTDMLGYKIRETPAYPMSVEGRDIRDMEIVEVRIIEVLEERVDHEELAKAKNAFLAKLK